MPECPPRLAAAGKTHTLGAPFVSGCACKRNPSLLAWDGLLCFRETNYKKHRQNLGLLKPFSQELGHKLAFIIVREIPTENEKLSSSGKYRYFEDPGPRAGFSSPPSFYFSTLVRSANGTAPEFFSWELPLLLLTE